jgi:hypothetical protein
MGCVTMCLWAGVRAPQGLAPAQNEIKVISGSVVTSCVLDLSFQWVLFLSQCFSPVLVGEPRPTMMQEFHKNCQLPISHTSVWQ